MALSPIEFNGSIQRAADIGVIKHQDDIKAAMNQSHIQSGINKAEEENASMVTIAENVMLQGFRYDAREESRNKYEIDKKKKKKSDSDSDESDGRVINKSEIHKFDVSI